KSLRCTLSAPPRLMLNCDPDKMARVFENLLRNACHYSLEGGEISICGSVTDEAVTLVFRNPGKTIPPEKLERIFDQFFRLDASRGTQTGGSGLGLAIAREIVEAHGGLLRAESADNTVSFILTLPAPAVS
ncbi:MAG: ATP-binding protein, partial [Oscillospiraceae bacterium]|nr:ATP-binding protein [Oscillospiraceae bacterium]